MPEGSSNKPFVVTDRRRFTTEGEVRPDAPPLSEERSSSPATAPAAGEAPSPSGAPQPVEVGAAPNQVSGPQPVPPRGATEDPLTEPAGSAAADYPAPTEEQTEQSRIAYQQTADRLDTAIRATNPGMDHPPAANFEQLVQSLYMTALVQLGGVTPEGEKPRVDLLGARQSIDLLGVLSEKSRNNLTSDETKFLDSALFELRMAFLEVTQVLARSAAARSQVEGSPVGAGPGPFGGKR